MTSLQVAPGLAAVAAPAALAGAGSAGGRDGFPSPAEIDKMVGHRLWRSGADKDGSPGVGEPRAPLQGLASGAGGGV